MAASRPDATKRGGAGDVAAGCGGSGEAWSPAAICCEAKALNDRQQVSVVHQEKVVPLVIDFEGMLE